MPGGECKHEMKIVPALEELSVKEARRLRPGDFPAGMLECVAMPCMPGLLHLLLCRWILCCWSPREARAQHHEAREKVLSAL